MVRVEDRDPGRRRSGIGNDVQIPTVIRVLVLHHTSSRVLSINKFLEINIYSSIVDRNGPFSWYGRFHRVPDTVNNGRRRHTPRREVVPTPTDIYAVFYWLPRNYFVNSATTNVVEGRMFSFVDRPVLDPLRVQPCYAIRSSPDRVVGTETGVPGSVKVPERGTGSGTPLTSSWFSSPICSCGRDQPGTGGYLRAFDTGWDAGTTRRTVRGCQRPNDFGFRTTRKIALRNGSRPPSSATHSAASWTGMADSIHRVVASTPARVPRVAVPV